MPESTTRVYTSPNNDGFAKFANAHPTVLSYLDEIADAFDTIQQAVRGTTVKQRKKLIRERTLLILAAASYTEFTEISTLAMTGFGSGATKLLRALTERVTITLYLMKHPKLIQRYTDYTAINSHKLLVEFDEYIRTKKRDIPKEERDEIVKNYEKVKDSFRKRPCSKCAEKVKTLCSSCRADLKGPLLSWTPDSIENLAKDASRGLRKLFFRVYKAPLFFLHPSDWSVKQLMKADADGIFMFQHPDMEREAAYTALVLSGAVLWFLAKGCNKHFGLRLDAECKRVLNAVNAIQLTLHPVSPGRSRKVGANASTSEPGKR